MSVGGSLEDIVNDCAKLNDVDALKTYLLAIICELQQEIVKTKATVEDFRAVHKFDNIYEKGASINALVDPVVNSEILHLKQVLRAKEDELKAAKEQCEAQKFNPQAPIGRALFARCKDLMTENEELGRIVLQSQVQPLTLDLFKEREATKALKNQIMWMHQYNTELEEENDLLFNKSTKQAEEIAMLRKEKEEMAKRLDGHHRKADPDSSQAVSAMESSVLSNRNVSPRRDESTKHEHRSSKDDKLRYRDKKPSERRDSDRRDSDRRDPDRRDSDRRDPDRRDSDRRDPDRRDSDRRDPDRRESKHSERTKDDKYDDDKGLKRDSTKGVSSTSSIRKSERYSPRRDDRRGSSPKDTRSKRPERYRSRSRRNSRESVRDDRSPYRRRRRSRSPRSSRRY